MTEITVKELIRSVSKGQELYEEFTLPVKSKLSGVTFKGITFDKVHFNSLIIGGGLFSKTIFENCNFENSNLDGVNITKVEFLNCNFSNVILAKDFFTSINKSKFAHCKFVSCQIGETSATASEFLFCHFIDNRIKKLKFFDSKFNDVRFEGRLSNSSFVDSFFCDTDFSKAKLIDSTIVNCLESSVVYPGSEDNFAVKPELLEVLKPKIEASISAVSYNKYCALCRVFSSSKSVLIIDDVFFSALSGIDSENVRNILFEERHHLI